MYHSRCFLFHVGACTVFILLAITSANAQFKAGIQGTVTDVSGALVPDAKIILTNTETGKTQETASTGEGFYRVSGLAPGKYKLTVEAAGYKQKVFEHLVVNAEAVQGIDVALEPGEVSATVTVTQETAQTLETENANVDKAITTQEVRTLPQFGRDPYELTRLTRGVFGDFARGGAGGAVNLPNQSGPGGSNSTIFQTENQPQISANGQRISANNYQIDGTSVNSLTWGGAAVITPNQESVKEVRVMANSYSAEFGRNSGAQVLTVSQNGTNVFHGSLFLKNNSPGLNAFNKYGGVNNARPIRNNQHYNQFGGSIGGPIPMPRFGEGMPPAFDLLKNRAFFFFSYEGLRSSTSDTFNAWIETPEYRQLVQAVRPGSVTARILGASGIAPRAIGLIPVSCASAGISPCQQLSGGLDIGSPAGATGQYLSFGQLSGGGLDNIPDIQFAQIAAPSTTRGNQFNPRIDLNLTDRDTVTFSSYISRRIGVNSDTAGRSRPMGDVRTTPENLFGMLSYTRTISATTVNEARVNATRFAFNELNSSNTTNFGLPRIEIETLPFDRIRWGAPWSETTPGVFSENTFEGRDVLRNLRGNHALSLGGELRLEQDNNDLLGGARPLYTFAGLFNFANSTPLFYQIDADPRTGGPPDTTRHFRSHTLAFFGQDDWKFKPNLTLNLGLRWEYFSPLTERDGKLSNLSLGTGAAGLTGASIVRPDKLYPSDWNNFSPRVAFAWSPKKLIGLNLNTEDKFVLRGGFGIAYNRLPNVLFANSRGNPPFMARYTICCGTSASDFSTPFNGGEILYALGSNNTPFSFPANPALTLTFNSAGIPTNTGGGKQVEIWGAPADVPTPYVYTYSLEGQYSLPAQVTATVGYQGSAGRKLVRLVNERFIFPNDPGNFFASGVFFPTPDTTSSYNALLVTLSRRFSRGIAFDANYRWAKSIDIVSNENPTASTNPTFPLDVRQERGPSDYDVRHNLILSGLWEVPFFRHRSDGAGKILGGWELSAIGTFHTGFPWTPVIGQCVSTLGPSLCPVRPSAYFGGAGNDTSNAAFISGSNFPGGGAAFFDTSSPNGRLPGIGRNSFRGPKYRDVDLTVGKRFGMPNFLGEGANFELKANFFNVFNILNLQPFGFNTDSTNVTNPNFGKALGGLSGRVVEIQGRFNF
ncbi:MAG: TonB-dependent receptor domain-containing protein [Pyrinomonadaceae bacterium]